MIKVIHQFVDGHLDYFHFFAIVNSVTIDIHIQVYVGIPVFNSFWYIPRNEIAKLYDISIINF